MTYSIGGTEIIHANNKINWNKVLAPSLYFGVSNTSFVANNTSGLSARFGYSVEEANSTSIRLKCTAYNCACVCNCECSSCFLGSALVRMADGTDKRIDQVKVGDKLVGAYGEINAVLALDLTTLGNRPMYQINGNHYSSPEHSHIGINRKFYVPDVHEALKEWKGNFPVVNERGETVQFYYAGLSNLSRLEPMKVGNILIHVDGPKFVETFGPVWMPPETPLYTLVMSGSHTYTADGYAVVGWPRDDDFDYDNWISFRELTLEDYKAR